MKAREPITRPLPGPTDVPTPSITDQHGHDVKRPFPALIAEFLLLMAIPRSGTVGRQMGCDLARHKPTLVPPVRHRRAGGEKGKRARLPHKPGEAGPRSSTAQPVTPRMAQGLTTRTNAKTRVRLHVQAGRHRLHAAPADKKEVLAVKLKVGVGLPIALTGGAPCQPKKAEPVLPCPRAVCDEPCEAPPVGFVTRIGEPPLGRVEGARYGRVNAGRSAVAARRRKGFPRFVRLAGRPAPEVEAEGLSWGAASHAS